MQCPLLSINFSLGLPGDPTHVQSRVFFILYDSACRQPSFILSYCASVPILLQPFLFLSISANGRQTTISRQYPFNYPILPMSQVLTLKLSPISLVNKALICRIFPHSFYKHSLFHTLLQFIAQILLTFHLYFPVYFSVSLANFIQSDLFKVFLPRSFSKTISVTISFSLNPPLLPFMSTISCLSLLLRYFHYSQPIPLLSPLLLRCSVQLAHPTCL